MSSSGDPSVEGEPPRKRVRKGTRSCWECKRRKIRCQLSSEDVAVCSGCVTRGTTCLSQEYPEERDTPSGNQVGERLGRVERLLETLVSKIEAFEEEENVHKIMTPESVGNDVLTPYTTNASANPNVAENAPFLSLFDNSVFGRRDNVPSQANSPAEPTTGTRTPSCRPSKLDRIRQALVDLLPSQQDTDLIRNASSSWLLLYALNDQKVEEVSATTFNIQEVSKRHPTSIARSILYIAVCVQQLDPRFDTSRLHLLPTVDARIDKYISTVQSLVTSDDEMVATTEGLECLILQGVFHINAGNPRRAWLTLRRAINLGQLMGIHRKKGSATIPGGRQMWFHAVQAERYLGLLLGLPNGSADLDFEPEETFQNPNVNIDDLFQRKLCNIVGRVIERNQSDHSQVYATTQSIDEQMEQLYNEMPAGWWDVHAFIPSEVSLEAVKIFNRIMSEMWYFQVQAFLHLPFMLRASKERRYEYSRFSCLKASREMIVRYLALRRTGTTSFCCNVVDFGALTSTVTLYLVSILPDSETGESQAQRQQKESDKAMVQAVLKHMEDLSQGGRDLVATQSVSVIKSLLAISSPDSTSNRQTGTLKLTIPYFGTISIARPPPVEQDAPNTSYDGQLPQQSIPTGQQPTPQSWQSSYTPRSPGFATQTQMPVISFMSCQFPELSCQVPCEPEPQQPQPQQQQQQQQIQDWSLPEDNLFFDSLLQTDLEGNWIY